MASGTFGLEAEVGIFLWERFFSLLLGVGHFWADEIQFIYPIFSGKSDQNVDIGMLSILFITHVKDGG